VKLSPTEHFAPDALLAPEQAEGLSEKTRLDQSALAQCYSALAQCYSALAQCYSALAQCYSALAQCYSALARCYSAAIGPRNDSADL
jgi:hypothetical protein